MIVETAMTCSRKGSFVIPTLAGTSYDPLTEALLPSTKHYETHPICILPLSRDDARSLVRTTFKNGEMWLQQDLRSFDILLDAVRGNPRALWVLKEVLDERDPTLPFDIITIIDHLIKPIEDTFRSDAWGGAEEGLLILLSAIMGIPVSVTEVDYREFQKAGLVAARPAPTTPSPLWVKRWSLESKVLLDIPFVLALAAIRRLRTSLPNPRTGACFYYLHINKELL